MACRDAFRNTVDMESVAETELLTGVQPLAAEPAAERLFFGVDSETPATELLQNNLTQYDWVERNKLAPNFWGRNIMGGNRLTKEEVSFLHERGCTLLALCKEAGEKLTEEQGTLFAKKVTIVAMELGVPAEAAIFLELSDQEAFTAEYLKGFAKELLLNEFMPGFKANTDAAVAFDRVYSQGVQNDTEVFDKCAIWATAPILAEYDRITTSHLIQPDEWVPFAPSGTTRKKIAVWQYGKGCHPIQNSSEQDRSFNIDLIRNTQMLLEKTF